MADINALEEFLKLKHDIPLADVEKICKNVFIFAKKEVENCQLNDIRLKYFGVFTNYPGRLKYMKKMLEKKTELTNKEELLLLNIKSKLLCLQKKIGESL